MNKVAVVGAGTMGLKIAQAIAKADIEVTLHDAKEGVANQAVDRLEKELHYLVGKGKITQEEMNTTTQRIQPATMDKISKADVVIEAIFENPQVKKDLFVEIEKMVSTETIIATNTSSLSITELASVLTDPTRFIGIHFFNPADRMQLIELIKGEFTSEATLKKARSFSERINKIPVEVVESPGFIVNRLLIPMINEAIFILDEGIATAEDIDKAMKLGSNHPIGPLALADLIGLDVVLSIMEVLLTETNDSKYRPALLLKKKVRAGQLGRKTSQGFYQYPLK
ncbi:3-hydroxyacyl-CoA dehydrogenase family protein [Enterococcus sp. AZ109]|uniref:3-hydroxyacyl-CoA dehydrogenase family protein n=1 Tax=Enterococcus sp. AZ109 TaxID=2774634 RepID=UPI003F28AC58